VKENSIKIIEEKIKALDLHIQNYETADCKTSVYEVLQEERNALVDILQDYKRVLKENEELENITDKMIDYIMMHQQVKTMRKIFCKHCKLQNSCTYSGIHRNCVIRYFEYISKQGNISKMHEDLEKILESEE
jgi:3-oxoacyl-[acyl-carrier-protein] synthase III